MSSRNKEVNYNDNILTTHFPRCDTNINTYLQGSSIPTKKTLPATISTGKNSIGVSRRSAFGHVTDSTSGTQTAGAAAGAAITSKMEKLLLEDELVLIIYI